MTGKGDPVTAETIFEVASLSKPVFTVRDLSARGFLELGPSPHVQSHWGSNPGFQRFVIASLRDGSGLLLLTNSENGLRLAGGLVPEIYPGEHPVFQFRMLHPEGD